jgi:hypothetical protein
MSPVEKPIASTAISRDCNHLESQHEPAKKITKIKNEKWVPHMA